MLPLNSRLRQFNVGFMPKGFYEFATTFSKHGFDSHPFEQCKTRPTEIYLYVVLSPARFLAELQLILVPTLQIISLNRCYNMNTNTTNNYLIIIISTTTTIAILTIKSAHCLLLTSHLIEEWAVGDTDIFDNILNGLHIIREAAVILYWKRIRSCSKMTTSLKGGGDDIMKNTLLFFLLILEVNH